MQMKGVTDRGQQRKNNQDAFCVDTGGAWCMVADGMGGHNGGETASNLAVEEVRKGMELEGDSVEQRMCSAIDAANSAVYQKALSSPELSGMGTTVVLLCRDGDDAVVAHVGDSRAYHITRDGVWQITTDHSIVQQLVESGSITPEEAQHHPQKNFITRAVGTDPTVDVDINRVPCSEGDYFLLCSDGLTAYVDDELLGRVVREQGVEKAPEILVRLANEGGGRDNITAVVITF